ncbi:SDR family NAD(P)-dependent oxidoreductase [Gordonia neofelifaecis]|uniref:Short-chain dehydrogenase/reductase SDR n=1 Tax=Gordonia neofelifaecis NRRL B-59395 TaxID=644548 RepID=F1YPF9_9ACTN|nr:SDR family NAD(P)-dependent oxidoreductase [Gordonia neofelifaecis]EGD53410.1 short-chain dehydrogenase/reductase SDR [Gordonia neofelifaecis NRRL B-59395]
MASAAEVFGGGVLAVTGGGAGVGEGLARYAASIGMSVAIGDVDVDAAERVAADIVSAGGRAVARRVDVRDASQVEAWADSVYADLGPVRLLINNAGVEQFGYLWDTPVDNWRRLIDINVTGVFNGVKAFVPRMADAGEPAHIWNLSSIGGVAVAARQGPYIVSKHAVLALTENLLVDVRGAGLDISVAAVLPASVASNIFDSAGGVEAGDEAASDAEREAMLKLRDTAMSPLEAAERVFAQAAGGEFYLLTHAELVGTAMAARGEQLRTRTAPRSRT